ncbi:MAG: hypothetical protein IPL65_18355 [Lewinellaceae bacterium]|nr:hypothetical protein [Lewinellaceae bacterium]
MKNWYAFLLFVCPLFLPSEHLSAQTLQTLTFHAPGERIPITLQPGVNTVQVIDLELGKLHSFIAVGASKGQNNTFETHFTDVALETKAIILTPADRPQWRRCVAPTTAVELSITVAGDAFLPGCRPFYR